MKNDYTTGHQILTEEWREFYIRNPARFAEEYLGIKLTLFQKMVLTIAFWNRGNRDAFSSLLYAVRIITERELDQDDSAGQTCKHKQRKLTNCKNCGAVLHGNKCEYCGTEYDW